MTPDDMSARLVEDVWWRKRCFIRRALPVGHMVVCRRLAMPRGIFSHRSHGHSMLYRLFGAESAMVVWRRCFLTCKAEPPCRCRQSRRWRAVAAWRAEAMPDLFLARGATRRTPRCRRKDVRHDARRGFPPSTFPALLPFSPTSARRTQTEQEG